MGLVVEVPRVRGAAFGPVADQRRDDGDDDGGGEGVGGREDLVAVLRFESTGGDYEGLARHPSPDSYGRLVDRLGLAP